MRQSRRRTPCPTALPPTLSRARVKVGNLPINHFVASVAETPFGGVKDSGYGREGGTEGLQCCTVAKNVSHKMV
jgi:succinate-semialdehyde dehydrogenase / glutarate-semialdehyde dehydrogenase